MDLRTLPATVLLAFLPSLAQQMPSIVATATFNNIGIELTFATAPDTGARITMDWNESSSSLPWKNGHALSRIAPNKFAGSVFGLKAGTSCIIRLKGAPLPRDTAITISTRSDTFANPQGSVYHVAKDGSDSHDGSSLAQAFATLGKALSVAGAGSTILLHAGRYHESVTLPRSGTAQAPIWIRSAPGETAVLDGRDTSFHPTWFVHNASAGTYQTPCTVRPRLVYRNGQHLFACPTLSDLVANTWNMPEGFFADGSFLYVRLPSGRAPSANDTIQIPRFTTAMTLTGREHIRICGLEICYYGLGDYSRGIYLDNTSYTLIDSCFLHHNGIGVGLKRACNFNTIQRSTFTEGPIDTWNWSAVKEGTGYYEAGGVVVYGSSNANIGNVIRYNHFHHMFDGSHLYSEDPAGPTSNMDFHDNLVESINDDCVETDGAGTNCRIYNNVFRKFLTGVSVAPAQGGPTYIMRNLFSGWETHSGYVGYPVKFNVSSDLTIDWVYLYHNTCHTSVANQPGFLFKQYSNWNNVISRNNIYAGTNYALESTSSQNPVDFDYDNLYTTTSGRLIRWNGTTYSTIAAFAAATGQERHGLNRNPAFVDPAGGDYRLSATSPLIDSGVVIPGVNDDFAGDGPDIGRYEFRSEAALERPVARHESRFSMTALPGRSSGTMTLAIRNGYDTRSAASVDIFSMSGRPVFQANIPSGQQALTIAIRPARGVYIVRASDGHARTTQTLLVK